jgi:glycogen debranching enzyme
VSCDRDGDGLPENTDVGHGWVEMGPLAGGATTAYTAAIWIDALRRLSSTAHAVGDRDLAERVTGFRRRAEAGLEHLRDPRTGRLALHRTRDGRLATDLTALSAVPIALGVDTSPSADEILGALAEPRFTASWGLRMLPTDDPRHDPAAYHAGTVWPLFSGWAALADARRGAVDRAWARVRSIAMPTPDGCKGGFAEVLHGETGRLAGVCSNQAWSAAMLVTPVITGLLGVRPDAMSASCALHPRVPLGVTHVAVDRLRIGDRQLALVCQRLGDGVELQLGAPLDNPGVLAIDVRGERHTLPPGADLSVSLGAAR